MNKLRAWYFGGNERARQALIALAITLLLSVSTILDPFDRLGWMAQARLSDRSASGEIVFVGAREDVTDPARPERRVRLAQALRAMDRRGVERVFLDIVIDTPSDPAADRQLAEAIASLDGRIALTRRYLTGMEGVVSSRTEVPGLPSEITEVAGDRQIDFTGITWEIPYSVGTGEARAASLPAAIAGVESWEDGVFPVDYGYSLGSIPTLRLSDLTEPSGKFPNLTGKTVVVGEAWESSAQKANLPGHLDVPASLVAIYAAETLRAGATFQATSEIALAVFLLALLAINLLRPRRTARYIAYIGLVLAVPVASFVLAQVGVRASLTSAVALMGVYAALRLRTKWQQNFALIDQKTGLANFRALERALAESIAAAPVVVAKIHGFENVLKTLPQQQHTEYISRLIDRLKTAQGDLPIYANEGRYLAWAAENNGPASLAAHLEGLRALFSQPIILDGTEVDVGITFGVDLSQDKSAAARLASAIAAVERTSEAHAPIRFDQIGLISEDLWNISLQSRIDSALDKGEIFLVYQPKVCTKTGEMVGVESLVRWADPERGLIPPSRFISQCEKAGRMDHLTRHVLSCALHDTKYLARNGLNVVVSVNISATLLRDYRIEAMVKDALEKHAVAPEQLCLEITETSRIADIDNARSVLTSLANLGVVISIDDFGMGAANVETLFHLPFGELKIDQLFIQEIGTRKGRAIVKGLIALGADAGLEVVAEGVESPGTLRELARLGCPVVQGFAISRPISREEILQFQVDRQAKVN